MNEAKAVVELPSRAEASERDIRRLSDLSPQQWKSGIAAWLGWLFDGLDMHIYTLVATAFVAILLNHTTFRDEFAKLDKNQNGVIEATEWAAVEPLERVDQNHNGSISREE